MQKSKAKIKTRWELGNLDIYSGILFIMGIFVVSMGNKFGWFLIVLSFLKQLSGR